MLLFHGTTLENAKKIQKEGFSYDKQVWNCSCAETYFFTEDFFQRQCGSDDFSDIWDYAVRETLDQARICMAIENPKVYKGAVLVFDTELMDNGCDIEVDLSCENMDDCAVALVNPDLKGLVAVIYSTVDEKESRPFQLASLKNRMYLNLPKMSKCLESIVNLLSENDACYEILEDLRDSTEYLTTWIKKDLLNQDYFQEGVKEIA